MAPEEQAGDKEMLVIPVLVRTNHSPQLPVVSAVTSCNVTSYTLLVLRSHTPRKRGRAHSASSDPGDRRCGARSVGNRTDAYRVALRRYGCAYRSDPLGGSTTQSKRR
jgi:hypothetical protein